MSQPIYRAVEGEDGTVEYVKVDVTEIVQANLTDDVVKESDIYKNLLSESIERRQTIKSLREQMAALESEEDSRELPAEPQPQSEQQEERSLPTFDELYSQFKSRLLTEQQQEQLQQQERQQLIQKIATEENVSAALLRGNSEQELREHAKAIAKDRLQFSDIGANSTALPSEDDLLARVDKKLGWAD